MPPLKVTLDYDRRIPIYRQIYETVLAALASGSLARSEQLPTIHKLAGQLGVNPNTVARAYKDLERDGHLIAKRGRGTFPANTTPKPPKKHERESILAAIFQRALADSARHHINAHELAAYFQRRFRTTLKGDQRRDS
jgi:GntR family transcriptional regulator